jgi:apolipoprotein D and lipocalin family protein
MTTPACALAPLAALIVVAFATTSRAAEPLATVPKVDLTRYVGKWYEIARYPNRFQKKCASDTTANYTSLPNGKIEVVNSCRRADGSTTTARGKAKIVDTATQARLKVTFFWPFYGDYWIIGLAPDYRYAIVGEPSRRYLWILSRMPQMRTEDYAEAIETIRRSGYDPDRLIKTRQTER